MLHKYFFYILFLLILSSGITLLNAETEPNNTPEQANPLVVNGSDAGTLNITNDIVDWWKITLPSDGKLVIATLSDATLEIDNYIYDQDKTSLVAGYAYGGTHTWDTTYFNNLLAGTYYIKSSCWSGSGAYSITSHFIPANYQNDPEVNDSSQVANTFSLNGSATGHLGYYSLGYTDPADWRKVIVPLDGKLVIATLSDPTIEIDNYIYDQNKTSLLAGYAFGGSHDWDTSYFNNLTPGTYYIRTADYVGYGGYTITNNFIPARYPNDPEPNDSIPIAKSISINSVMSGHIGFYNRGITDDNDYFSFTTTSVFDTLFIRTDSDPTLEIDLDLYNNNGERINHAGVYGTTELLTHSNLQAGTYYVRVPRWTGYGSYGLIVTNVRPTTPLVSVENKTVDLLPKEFDLKQNYPNPFNPSTSIQYSVSSSQFVTLKIYDVLGNEIETLVNEEKPTGTYAVIWNTANLPSGIYFYRLQAGSFVQTRKMILMK